LPSFAQQIAASHYKNFQLKPELNMNPDHRRCQREKVKRLGVLPQLLAL